MQQADAVQAYIDHGFGSDDLTRMNGTRYIIARERRFIPAKGETQAAFVRRMERLEEALATVYGTTHIRMTLHQGRVVECAIRIQHEPLPAAGLFDRAGTDRARELTSPERPTQRAKLPTS